MCVAIEGTKSCREQFYVMYIHVLNYLDPSFVRTFLMTYRSFSEPHELLDLLVTRFHIPMPVDTEDLDVRRDPNMMKAIKRYKTNYISPIQLRYASGWSWGVAYWNRSHSECWWVWSWACFI